MVLVSMTQPGKALCLVPLCTSHRQTMRNKTTNREYSTMNIIHVGQSARLNTNTRNDTNVACTSLPNRSLASTFYQSYELLPTVFFLPPSLPSSGFCRLFLHFCRHGNIAGRFPIQPPPRQLPPPPCCGGSLGHLRSIVL